MSGDFECRSLLIWQDDTQNDIFHKQKKLNYDAPLRGHGGHDWIWEPDREHTIYPLEKLVEMYYKSVGHNTTLILGVTPNPEGLIPEADATRLKEFGQEIEKKVF